MNTHLAVHQQQQVIAKIGSAIHNRLAALLVDCLALPHCGLQLLGHPGLAVRVQGSRSVQPVLSNLGYEAQALQLARLVGECTDEHLGVHNLARGDLVYWWMPCQLRVYHRLIVLF